MSDRATERHRVAVERAQRAAAAHGIPFDAHRIARSNGAPRDVPPPTDTDAPPDAVAAPYENVHEVSRVVEAPARRIVLTDDDELDVLPEPSWLIAGILPVRGLGLLFGASETYKSFIALDAALHIVTGRAWHQHAVQQGTAVYVCGEGFFGLKHRRAAWKAHHDVKSLPGIKYLRHGIDVRRGSKDLVELRDAIREKLGDEVGLIVLDTLNRNFVGNENAPDAMGDYINGCGYLQESLNAAVVSLHHIGHLEAERARGHSSLHAALDVELQCERDGDRATITCTKMKDAPYFDALKFDLVSEGASLVPNPVGTVDVKLTPGRAKALAALPTENGLARSEWQKQSGLKPGTFRHALDWSYKMGYARQLRDGKYVRTASASLVVVPECQGGAT